MAENYDLVLKLFGDAEELKGMLEIAGTYFNNGNKPACFKYMVVNDREIDFSNIPGKLLSGGSAVVRASGLYGSYDELNDISLFRDLAVAFPQGKFIGEISGHGLSETQNLNCELKDGLLRIDTVFESDDEPDDAWIEYFTEKLPYDEFQEMFKIEGEDFDEGFYRCFLVDISGHCYDDFSELDFEYFVECLESIDYETMLDEDEFNEIMEGKFADLDIEPLGDFSLSYDGVHTANYVFDPVAKKYV